MDHVKLVLVSSKILLHIKLEGSESGQDSSRYRANTSHSQIYPPASLEFDIELKLAQAIFRQFPFSDLLRFLMFDATLHNRFETPRPRIDDARVDTVS